MNGSNNEKVIVQFEVSPARRADVASTLASLAVPNSIKIVDNISDTTAKFLEEISEPIKYNPELVSHIWDHQTETMLPVILDERFIDFSVKYQLADKRTANLLLNALYWDAQRPHIGRPFSPMYRNTLTHETALRADKLSELNRRYEDNNLHIKGVGVRLQKLLSDVELLLYANDHEVNPNLPQSDHI
ncbi:MAG TPA: hypothetical protein VII94_05055 [Candidatus Saccharimonadales bacterium]